MSSQSIEPFDKFLADLRDPARSLASAGLQRLSDLCGDELSEFKCVWPTMDVQRRRRIAAALVELSEENFEFDFTAVDYVLLEDSDPDVRRLGIEGLWESTTYITADRLVHLLHSDPSAEVRAEAAASLGRFTYLIELGKLDKITSRRVRDALLATYADKAQPLPVRRRVLEALGYVCDNTVARLIDEAYQGREQSLKASAVMAMGHACDPRWLDIILEETKSAEPEMRFEAARAAGELEDQRALTDLERLTTDEDPEVRYAAIAAIGEIGGQRAKRILRACQQSADPETREAAEEALEEMEFYEEPLSMPFNRPGQAPSGPEHIH